MLAQMQDGVFHHCSNASCLQFFYYLSNFIFTVFHTWQGVVFLHHLIILSQMFIINDIAFLSFDFNENAYQKSHRADLSGHHVHSSRQS
jgi:hypothetical protein